MRTAPLVLAAILFAGGACGDEARVATAPEGRGSTCEVEAAADAQPAGPSSVAVPDAGVAGCLRSDSAPLQSGGVAIDHRTLSFAERVAASDAAVVATIREVRPARWDNRDNVPNLAVGMSRAIVVAVEDVIYDSAELALGAGSELTIMVAGNGTERGADPDPAYEDGGYIEGHLYPGPLEPGDRALMLLYWTEYGWIDNEPRPTAGVFNRYDVWVLRGDRAESIVPNRSVPMAPLIERLRQERAAPSPRDPRSARGAENPLE